MGIINAGNTCIENSYELFKYGAVLSGPVIKSYRIESDILLARSFKFVVLRLTFSFRPQWLVMMICVKRVR